MGREGRDRPALRDGPLNVEYHRDVKPILERSCVACHTQKSEQPAGKLVLDDDRIVEATNPVTLGFKIRVPGTYKRLAADAAGKFGIQPLQRQGWRNLSASRYVRAMQSRRSLLIWKIYGERLDGFDNDDFVYETMPGDPTSLRFKGQPVPDTPANRNRSEIAYTGGPMPPPEAVAGTTSARTARPSRSPRCPTKTAGRSCAGSTSAARSTWTTTRRTRREPGYGWMLDDDRPTLTLSTPRRRSQRGADAHPGRHARLRHRPRSRELHGHRRLPGRRRKAGHRVGG